MVLLSYVHASRDAQMLGKHNVENICIGNNNLKLLPCTKSKPLGKKMYQGKLWNLFSLTPSGFLQLTFCEPQHG